MIPESQLESLLNWEDIQGNILGGFNKDHQTLIGLKLSSDLPRNKSFISQLSKSITNLKEVVSHKQARAYHLQINGTEPQDLRTVWTAAALSFDGLHALTPEADYFSDIEFREGLPKSSARLGDPTVQNSVNDFSQWVIGNPGNIPDVLVVVAADDPDELVDAVRSINQSADYLGVKNIYEETGHDLGYYSDEYDRFPSGHEHFGFKDGVSQPGIRGLLPNGQYLTKRTAQQEPPDNSGPEYAENGKPLVCVGQFVLGYSQQIDYAPREPGPPRPLRPEPNSIGPSWATNGSFLVFRRLRQDVVAFETFIAHNVSLWNWPSRSQPSAAGGDACGPMA